MTYACREDPGLARIHVATALSAQSPLCPLHAQWLSGGVPGDTLTLDGGHSSHFRLQAYRAPLTLCQYATLNMAPDSAPIKRFPTACR